MIAVSQLVARFCPALKEKGNQPRQIVSSKESTVHIPRPPKANPNLKNVKHKSKGKIRKEFNNKLQRWTYPKILKKLEMMSEESGVHFLKIDPAFTSQTCSRCHILDKSSRSGEFFKCKHCGLEIDADYNAALNILAFSTGEYGPCRLQTQAQALVV